MMLQQNIEHIAKYQDNKNHPKFVQTAKYCKRSFPLSSWEFTTSNLWPEPYQPHSVPLIEGGALSQGAQNSIPSQLSTPVKASIPQIEI